MQHSVSTLLVQALFTGPSIHASETSQASRLTLSLACRSESGQDLSLAPALPSPTNGPASISALTVDPRGGLLAAGCSDKTVRLWRLSDLQLPSCW